MIFFFISTVHLPPEIDTLSYCHLCRYVILNTSVACFDKVKHFRDRSASENTDEVKYAVKYSKMCINSKKRKNSMQGEGCIVEK